MFKPKKGVDNLQTPSNYDIKDDTASLRKGLSPKSDDCDSKQRSKSQVTGAIISSGRGNGSGIETNQIKLFNGLGLKSNVVYLDNSSILRRSRCNKVGATQVDRTACELVSIGGETQECVEEHRLLIDRAIDKLRGEIREKEMQDYQPMLNRQIRLV